MKQHGAPVGAISETELRGGRKSVRKQSRAGTALARARASGGLVAWGGALRRRAVILRLRTEDDIVSSSCTGTSPHPPTPRRRHLQAWRSFLFVQRFSAFYILWRTHILQKIYTIFCQSDK